VTAGLSSHVSKPRSIDKARKALRLPGFVATLEHTKAPVRQIMTPGFFGTFSMMKSAVKDHGETGARDRADYIQLRS
jgi:hypothetical protein